MKNQKNLFVNKKNSIKQAILKIKKNSTRTVIVVDDKKKLLGNLTEGDIQKALIKNKKINLSIESLYNRHPKKVHYSNIDLNEISDLFIKGQYGALPVIDDFDIVQKVLTWSEIFDPKNETNLKNLDVVIMAGGKGERLKPFTEILPKPLIPINSKPMLDHIIENFNYFNFSRFHLVLNHQANLIKSYFESKNKDYKIFYTKEPSPLGTAGGIYYVKKIKSQDFLISNCDTLFKIDYNKFYNFHKKNQNLITLAVSKTKHAYPYGICKTNSKKLISLKEKPEFNYIVNTGLYFVKKEIINLIPKNKRLEMTDLINKCIKFKKKIGVYQIPSDSWTDLGQLSDLKKVFKEI